MAFFLILLVAAFSFTHCSDDPGEIDLVLDGSGVAQASQDAVSEFVFIVNYPPGSSATRIELFPGACVGTVEGSSQNCLAAAPCGFSVSNAEFRPAIPFFDSNGEAHFPEGEVVEVVACGLDENHNLLVSGSDSNILNRAGESVTITLSDTDLSACNINLIPSCP